jgi:hypothetical protein
VMKAVENKSWSPSQEEDSLCFQPKSPKDQGI